MYGSILHIWVNIPDTMGVWIVSCLLKLIMIISIYIAPLPHGAQGRFTVAEKKEVQKTDVIHKWTMQCEAITAIISNDCVTIIRYGYPEDKTPTQMHQRCGTGLTSTVSPCQIHPRVGEERLYLWGCHHPRVSGTPLGRHYGLGLGLYWIGQFEVMSF